MVIDLNKYTVNKAFVIQWYKDNGKDAEATISIMACSIMVPCLVLAFYLAEEIGFTEELIRKIDILIKFYGYKKILNQQSDSPYLSMIK